MVTAVKTRRAVGYFRVSSPGQTGESHSSLETQLARFQKYCKAQDCESVGTFTDVKSGRRDDRAGYQRMVRFVLDGGADVVVVRWLDRFGRNPREILRRIWQLQDQGIGVEATDEDIREEFILLVRAGMAGAESKRTSERVRANMARVVGKGVHVAKAPYGYRRVRSIEGDKMRVSWEQDPNEAQSVREMFRLMVEENLGRKAIADTLARAGIRTRDGKHFAAFTIGEILSNESLVGNLVYGKKPRKDNPPAEIVRVEGFFPAILSQEEWRRLQERLAIRREHSRGRAHSSQFLLSGIARCGYCGGPMVGKVGARKMSDPTQRYRNYWCSRSQQSRGRCSYYNGHSARKLESAIIEHLEQYSDPAKVRELLAADDRREVARKEKELRQAEKRLGDLEAQFHRHVDRLDRGVLTEGDFKRLNDAARDERTGLEAKRDELSRWLAEARHKAETADSLPARIGSFLENFQHLDVRRQKAHLQTILKSATVYRDARVELAFRS